MGARGKDEVLPQPDGSIVSGGTVHTKNCNSLKLTGAFLSIGLMINFLSLKEMFLISLQGNPIFGVSLDTKSN